MTREASWRRRMARKFWSELPLAACSPSPILMQMPKPFPDAILNSVNCISHIQQGDFFQFSRQRKENINFLSWSWASEEWEVTQFGSIFFSFRFFDVKNRSQPLLCPDVRTSTCWKNINWLISFLLLSSVISIQEFSKEICESLLVWWKIATR